MITFWNFWNSKFKFKHKSAVIYGLHSDKDIAQKFATNFADVYTPNCNIRRLELKKN